uniref:ARAD1D48290p n=1 Tax=Blastobotrys adeninivorans TaxID=409370 RepID=A0A060TIP8_BLAAD
MSTVSPGSTNNETLHLPPVSTDSNNAAAPSPALMTPSTSKTVDASATEIRKPVRLSRSASPQVHSPAVVNYPLTFANSVSAGTAATSTATGDGAVSGAPSASDPTQDGNATAEESRVSAYARLDFESFTFYVQTLQVILGRRAENGSSMVDVHLGPQKAISRRHAKIFYNFGTQRFELSVLGRNGAFVGDVFVETDTTVPLKNGTRIQIGQIPFTFVLPSTSSDDSTDNNAADDPIIQHGPDPLAAASPVRKNSISGSPDLDLDDSRSVAQKRPIKREYLPEEIPEEYREKPQHSYSYLIASALRARGGGHGMSLSEIYRGIQDLFPYYKYCPPGWQNSVRHNLSSNKAFHKIAKEGKGWLWGIDEEYFLEKERQKKKASEKKAAAAAAHASSRAVGSTIRDSVGGPTDLADFTHHEFHVNNISPANDLSAGGVGSSASSREKTIAELAQEIEIHRQGTRHYNPDTYTPIPVKSEPGSSASPPPSSDYNGTDPSKVPNYYSSFSSAGSSSAANPRAPQVQPSLAAGQSTFRMVRPPPSQHSPSPGPSSISSSAQNAGPQMKVQPQGQSQSQSSEQPKSGVAAAMQAAGIKLNPNTIKTLAKFQQKLQETMGGNTQMLTQTLALAIAQAAKESGGGPQAIANMLNSKNPSQLIQLLTNALAAVKTSAAKKGKQGSPQPESSQSAQNAQQSFSQTLQSAPVQPGSQSQPQPQPPSQPTQSPQPQPEPQSQPQPQPEPQSEPQPQPQPQSQPLPPPQPEPSQSPQPTQPSSQVPSQPPSRAPSQAPSQQSQAASQSAPQQPGEKKGPSLEVINKMIDQASKIKNPSPDIQKALKQLREHAQRLMAAQEGAQKRPADSSETEPQSKQPRTDTSG